MQTINRADQAICLDYTLGMRILSPAQQPGAPQDPIQVESMGKFVSAIKNMVRHHRADPATYHTAPYPIQYQFAGGEGATLLPADKLKFRHQEYLNSLGIPLEYHSMTLSVQAAPMALQLFEAYWQAIPALYNRILAWIVDVCARNFDLEDTAVVMQKTTVSYDEGRKQILMQLMAANQISPQTALAAINVDAENQIKKLYQHQANVAKEQQKADEQQQEEQEMGAAQQLNAAPGSAALLQNQQQQQAGGGQGGAMSAGQQAGGMGGMPGGGQPKTIEAMSDQADQIAQQLVSMPDYDRKQQLKQIRESNKDLHSLVMAKMEKLRSSAASQGGQQILQGGQGGAPQPGQ
jgi:archaellum component FlaC